MTLLPGSLLTGLALVVGPVSFTHPVFTVTPRSVETATTWRSVVPPARQEPSSESADQGAVEEPTSLVDAATGGTWLWFLGVFAVIGSTVFGLLLRRVETAGIPWAQSRDALERGAVRLAGYGAILLLIAGPIRLYLQAASFVDPGEHLTAATVGIIVSATLWGTGWIVQMIVAALVALGAAWALQKGRSRPPLTIAVAVLLATALSTPMTGHGVAGPWPPAIQVLLQGLHVLGGATWLGTLAGLLIVGFGASRTLEPEMRARLIQGLVLRFSPIALTGAGTAILAGSALSWLYVQSIPALWQTVYGRTLLLKLGTLAIVLALGAFNWRRVKPTLGTPESTERLRRSAGTELAFGLLLLAITAVLVALPTPHM